MAQATLTARVDARDKVDFDAFALMSDSTLLPLSIFL